MRFFIKMLLFAAIFSSIAFAVQAQEQDQSRFDEELNERDFDALRDYLKRKRAVEIAENEVTNLTISGDVRTEWRHLNESCCGKALRGSGKKFSQNDFDIEFNLRFDYICERSWAVAHIRYDNPAGVDDNGHPCEVDEEEPNDNEPPKGCNCKEQAGFCNADPEGFHGSGRCNDLCLKKAYFGYSICKCDDYRFDIEVGRRGNIYNVFDSNIQFLSRLDGIVMRYQETFKHTGDWYAVGAVFLVDEKANHFAWVVETGLLDIAETNVDLKYSFIDWEKHGENRCHKQNPRGFRFLNSQWLIAYHIDPCYFTVPVKLYAAFLCNHAAKRRRFFKPCVKVPIDGKSCKKNGDEDNEIAGATGTTNSQAVAASAQSADDGEKKPEEKSRKLLQNLGWYAGILIGKVVKEGDWALEIQYQVVQAQAVPDDDCGGICRGNVLDESFTTCSQRGNTNFSGWRIEGLYAITDNLTLNSIVEWSRAFDERIGGRHKYSKFEMEAIYAF